MTYFQKSTTVPNVFLYLEVVSPYISCQREIIVPPTWRLKFQTMVADKFHFVSWLHKENGFSSQLQLNTTIAEIEMHQAALTESTVCVRALLLHQ